MIGRGIRALFLIGSMVAAPLIVAQNTSTIPSGTEVKVRTDQAITANSSTVGHSYSATVSQDVLDANGKVAIPRGSTARLQVVKGDVPKNVAMDLRSVTINGQQYTVESTTASSAQTGGKQGVGKNSRTAKYVGGGALAGTLLGAIAGGGKGAAIGALAGGAAGAGAQTLTKGTQVNVPAETQLTFRLAQDLQLTPYSGSSTSHRHRLPPPQ